MVTMHDLNISILGAMIALEEIAKIYDISDDDLRSVEIFLEDAAEAVKALAASDNESVLNQFP